MRPRRAAESIIIAGAGIAGLSAAVALKRAGFSVTVFERETVLQPLGAGIQLGPNATRILEDWDLDLLASAAEPEAIELHNAQSGRFLNSIPLMRAARARYGAPYVTLLRADLQKALLSRAQELGIVINFGAPVSGLARIDKGIRVTSGENSVAAAATARSEAHSPSAEICLRSISVFRRIFSTPQSGWAYASSASVRTESGR